MATKDKVALKLLDVLRSAKWHDDGMVVARRDEFFPEKPIEMRYEVKGKMRTDRAVAMQSWTPDKLREACLDVGDEMNAQVTCSADFEIEVGNVKVQHLLKNDSVEVVVQRGVYNVVLTWTSFHGDTDAALQSLLNAIESKRFSSSTRIVTLAMDEEPFQARAKAKKLGLQHFTECLWTGEEGWESKAAQRLNVDDSHPIFFLFNDEGEYLTSGDLDDALRESNQSQMNHDALNIMQNEFVSAETWQQARILCRDLNEQHRGRLVVSLRTISTSTTKNSNTTSIRQRVIVSGEVFEDSLAKSKTMFEELGAYWTAFIVLRPRSFHLPLHSNGLCPACQSTVALEFHCMVCDTPMCQSCEATHDKHHPLIVIKFAQRHNFSKSLFGIGSVEFDEDPFPPHLGNHPDLGCDACLNALAQGRRFKNLARDEHELCEKCFNASTTSSQTNKETFHEKFSCFPDDPFALLKTSRGVYFDRLAKREPSKAPPPSGHTQFSWSSSLREEIPYGHTHFSWCSV